MRTYLKILNRNKIAIAIFILILILFLLFKKKYEKYTNQNLDITVIITASHVPSHPDTMIIQEVLDSLHFLNLKENTHIIITHDVPKAGYNNKYLEYLKRLDKYITTNSELKKYNIQIVKREKYGHLMKNIKTGFEYVKTDWVLILQHDLPFLRNVDINKVYEDMKSNSKLKMVRFDEIHDSSSCDLQTWLDKPSNLYGKEIQEKNYTYTRTPCWSDRNHLCHINYYKDIVFKDCDDNGFMETCLNPKILNEEIHNRYGVYLFDKKGAPGVISHDPGAKYKGAHTTII